MWFFCSVFAALFCFNLYQTCFVPRVLSSLLLICSSIYLNMICPSLTCYTFLLTWYNLFLSCYTLPLTWYALLFTWHTNVTIVYSYDSKIILVHIAHLTSNLFKTHVHARDRADIWTLTLQGKQVGTTPPGKLQKSEVFLESPPIHSTGNLGHGRNEKGKEPVRLWFCGGGLRWGGKFLGEDGRLG